MIQPPSNLVLPLEQILSKWKALEDLVAGPEANASAIMGAPVQYGALGISHWKAAKMASLKSTAQLKRVCASDVQKWFREAWPDQKHYPTEGSCYAVAIRVNTIVDRHNASPRRAAAEEAMRRRREDNLFALRRARAFGKELHRMMAHLKNEETHATRNGIQQISDELARHISVTAQALAAVENYLGLPEVPKFLDHADPIPWIGKAAEAAWFDFLHDGPADQKKVPLGKQVGGPLVKFISLTLGAIGLEFDSPSEDNQGMISEHLRIRQYRPRPNRAARANLGAK